MKLDAERKLALSLPDTPEKPHHRFGSFRVKSETVDASVQAGAQRSAKRQRC